MTRSAGPHRAPPQRFLLVNDYGFGAPGLVLLEDLVPRLSDDVWVVAPDDERSGMAAPAMEGALFRHRLGEACPPQRP